MLNASAVATRSSTNRKKGMKPPKAHNSLHPSVYVQASLAPRVGGLGIASAVRESPGAFLAASIASFRFIRDHFGRLVPQGRLSASAPDRLSYVAAATRALALYQQQAQLPPGASLDALLSASPSSVSQHTFAEKVHHQAVRALLDALPDDYNAKHRARLVSCGGAHAGAWLSAIPVDQHTTVLTPAFRRALHLRLGVPLRELASGHVRCACGEVVDPYGFHYGSGCRRGNRGNAWGARHEMANDALISGFRGLGVRGAHAVSQNYLGEAALTGRGIGYKRPDGRLRGYHSLDRHVYWDTAVADPAGLTALRSGSALVAGAGVAARRRCAAKDAKYRDLVEGAGSQWVAAVVERFGAVSGPLQGLFKQVAGEGERDPLRDDGWTFSASSRVTFLAQRFVLAAVIGDALMVESLCARDAFGSAPPGVRRLGPVRGPVGSGYCFDEASDS